MDQIINVANSSDTIVIGDFEDRAVPYANLHRVTAQGEELWRAAPPGGAGDWWVAARIEGGELIANSWSCCSVRLDLATGEELRRVFTK